jgi:mRNA interferase YafQ
LLTLETTSQFRRDYKRIRRRGYDLTLLKSVIDTLLAEKPLDARHCDHALGGDMKAYRECHIRPDWLLIYRIESDQLILLVSRTGTHADLLGI